MPRPWTPSNNLKFYAGHRPNTVVVAASQQHHPDQVGFQAADNYDPSAWRQQAPSILQQLGLPASSSPDQLWNSLSKEQQQPQELQQQLHQCLDLSSCRLLLSAAAATCSTQQQLNRLQPLIQAAPAVFPDFKLADFQQLLQLCTKARLIPDKEWLASIYYADTGGFERLYKQERPEDLVLLLSDLSAMLASLSTLLLDTKQQTLLLQQQQQQQQDQPGPQATTEAAAAAAVETAAEAAASLAAEVAALQSASQLCMQNLLSIQRDPLLSGELSAVAGYWLLRRFLPQVQQDVQLLLTGLCALPGLGFRVLDASDADALLSMIVAPLVTQQPSSPGDPTHTHPSHTNPSHTDSSTHTAHSFSSSPSWSPSQLAAAVTACLPCLGDTPPSEGQQLALLFAAVEAAAGGMSSKEAAGVLLVLAQLPGYAPAPKVAQLLLDSALSCPLDRMSARQLYQLLSAASELGAVPSSSQMQRVQGFLGS